MRAALRSQNFPAVEQVEAVVLETDGTLSVLPAPQGGRPTALRQVIGAPEATDGNS